MNRQHKYNPPPPFKWYYGIFFVPIYVLMSLPLPVLYVLSDLFCWLARDIIRYRKKVILTNLQHSVPEKSDAERHAIMHRYYRNMIDVFIETFKALTISKKELMNRVRMKDIDVIFDLFKEGRSVVLMLGHCGNWEWGGYSYTYHSAEQTNTLYHPLSNPFFEWLTYVIRSRCGVHMIPMQNTLRTLLAYKDRITLTAFVSDQSPPPESAYWTTFLNQDTGFFTGAEKIAQKFNHAVVYAGIEHDKRGDYVICFKLLSKEPKQEKEFAITQRFADMLEEEIKATPELWLWSHRRWKTQKPTGI